MYNVSNGTLKLGQAVQYKACAISGRGGEQQAGHTEIFLFTAISRATDVRFINVFISLDSSFQ